MKVIDLVKKVCTTKVLRKKVEEGENVVVLVSQGLSGKPCIFIQKDFFNKHLAEVGKLVSEFQLTAMRDTSKQRLLGEHCSKVHGFEADPSFLAKLNPEGVEEYSRANTLRKCVTSIPVAPI